MRSQFQSSRWLCLPTMCPACRRKPRVFSTTSLPTYRAPNWRVALPSAWIVQRRHITQQHLRRIAAAKEQWDMWAKQIEAGERQSFLSLLEDRGLINSVVGDRDVLEKLITKKRVGFYAGVDPTAPSLHIGHMLPFMILGWAYVHGMKAVWLLGATTSKIGDPTGRVEARRLMKSALRKANIANIHLQLKKLGASFEKYGAKYGYQYEWAWRRVLANNSTWWNKSSFGDVITELGSNVRLGPMLGRDNVKSRLESGHGMSLAEFCYPIMQAWDFLYLFKHDVQIQVGGSDQYGNILFGIDAIKGALKHDPKFGPKLCDDPDMESPIGITTPLLTTPSGEKIGKSMGNATWLDKDMTSCFDLYQHFVRTPDETVEKMLKMFTFIPIDEIKSIMRQHNMDVTKRVAQHKLAMEFVELIHGHPEAIAAAKQHHMVFASASSTDTSGPESESASGEDENYKPGPHRMFQMPSPHLTLPRSLIVNQFFHKVLWSAGMVASKAEGFRLIASKGVHVGSMADAKQTMGDFISYTPILTWPTGITEKFIIDNSLMILRIGKWNIKIIKIVPDEEYEKMGLDAPGWKDNETREERQEDNKMYKARQKIKGRRVKLPPIAQAPEVEIRSWKPGQEEPVLSGNKEGDAGQHS
ncbi:tyrosyl-tRNA synthetase [Ophidiomyces ophidiicola]|uniref:tyrosyl-tRNA synthetase n=1 Tax=Ophidiomyces ophidiicola TaxID=1387563 RepID=UPI0020C21AB5|nr:tyrosyl-tRNA synthetase [Ophidiomyces ophidiicola]KAI1951003.1 tyrosyl-tRNA synthetase [Ophidiomyces ophidiicola]KAI2060945.1 tyrosyl-tRNA synthetase [Ophidiomyces ophidiicola]